MNIRHSHYHQWLFVFSVLLLTMGAGRMLAQGTDSPIVRIGGDYYTSDGASAPKAITTWGYNQQLVMSPDGTHFAYLSYPQTVVDALKVSGDALVEKPTNIWLMNQQTLNSQKLADQPPEAAFFSAETPDKAVVRSLPAWSADGKKLAWTEIVLQDIYRQRIVVYDLASDTATTVATSVPATIRYQNGQSVLSSLLWVGDWLVVHGSTAVNSTPVDALLVYAQDGSLHQTIVLNANASRMPLEILPVGVQVAVYYSSGAWEVVDPDTGATQPSAVGPEMYSLHPASNGSMTISTSVNSDHTFSIQVVDAQGKPSGEAVNVGASLDGVALSPYGTGAAYISGGTASVLRQGYVVPLPSDEPASILVWGASAWRMPSACPGAMPTRLTVGGQGRVVPGTGSNNLRAQPSKQAAKKGAIAEGDTFTVMAGPKCGDGMMWWGVNDNGTTGWTAEGKDNQYYVEPVSG